MEELKKELEIEKKYVLEGLVDPIPNGDLESFLISSSKCIRSTLAILFLKSFSKNIDQTLYKILAVGEIIHNSSLLHDDVIDNAQIRRGQTTFANKYSNKVSILAGDFLLIHAINKLMNINNSEITNLFKNCIQEMINSELKQYFYRGYLPNEKDYINICFGKTGILFATILEACAIVSGLSKELAYNLGKYFGIIFQINNDLEKASALIDKQNKIYTALDILGIENTKALLDNYKSKLEQITEEIPNNIYKKELEDLYKKL